MFERSRLQQQLANIVERKVGDWRSGSVKSNPILEKILISECEQSRRLKPILKIPLEFILSTLDIRNTPFRGCFFFWKGEGFIDERGFLYKKT